MVDPAAGNWQSPSDRQPPHGQQPHGQQPGPGSQYPTTEPPGVPPIAGYPGADPNQNWGLAPGGPLLTYETLIPRPPRPRVVSVALTLVYAGVLISAVQTAANAIFQWQHRDEVLPQSETSTDPTVTGFAESVTAISIGFAIFLWLIVAAGAVVCAILTDRKKNAARITLASFLGVIAMFQLCAGVANLVSGSILDSLAAGDSQFDQEFVAIEPPWWLLVGPFALGVLAAVAAVLLIVPSANRYFTAGAGRRFTPDV